MNKKNYSITEIVTLIGVLLSFAGTVGVSFYQIHLLESEMNSRKLEIGQIKQKLISANQVSIDFILKSSMSEVAKNELKQRLDKINMDWTQYIDGGNLQGPSFVDSTNDKDKGTRK